MPQIKQRNKDVLSVVAFGTSFLLENTMIRQKDEKWLKKILADCFEDESDSVKNLQSLAGFRILVINLVKNLEKNVDQIQKLCETEPKRQELRERLDILAKHLFYLRRFCQGKKEKGGKDNG